MLKENDALIFLHIPKTAGSTFHTILGNQYKKRSTKGVFGSRYSESEIAQFVSTPKEQKNHIRLLKGHMPFGLHEYLPRPARYITVLRDPVERVISQYYYIKKNAHNPLHDAVEGGKMSIEEFVASGVSVGMNNGQCRFINGDLDEYEFGSSDRALVENAIIHVEEHFEWIGITERFDESVLLLSELLGWKTKPYYIKENVSKTRKKSEEFDGNSIKIIKDYNAMDIELYNYACHRLDKEISRTPDFDGKLNRFVEKNERFDAWLGWLPARIRNLLV